MEHICNVCNKKYSSYQSLWIHNKKYHNNTMYTTYTNCIQYEHNKTKNPSTSGIQSNPIQNNICKFCKKELYNRQSRWRHELKCQIKSNQEDIKSELIEIKNEIKNLKNTKSGPTQIIKKVQGNIINGNNTDNGPKQIIYKTGSENMDLLTYNEVGTIFDNEISSVIKLIELVNFSEAKPENHSFCSTALESPYLSFYNTDTNSVNKSRKKYFFEEVICKSIQNHEILYKKFKNKFTSDKKKKIEDNIINLKKMKENSFNSKIMGELIRNLNLLSYNKRDLILDTWSGKKYDNDSDEEFMEMLLDDETKKIIASEKVIEENKNKSNDYISSDYSDNSDDSSDDSENERPQILLQYNKPKKNKNIIV